MKNSLFSRTSGFNYNQYLKNIDDPMNCIIDPVKGIGGVYLGNIDAASNVDLLKSNGINAVVTVAARANIRYSRRDIEHHYKIDAEDIPSQDLSQYFQRIIDFIDQHRAHTNVLVHCFAGISRSATSVIAYLMTTFGWNYEKCFNYVFHRRQIINPNPGFVRQLQKFEMELKTSQTLSVPSPERKTTRHNLSNYDTSGINLNNSISNYSTDARPLSGLGNLNSYSNIYPRSNSSSNINTGLQNMYQSQYYNSPPITNPSLGTYSPLKESMYQENYRKGSTRDSNYGYQPTQTNPSYGGTNPSYGGSTPSYTGTTTAAHRFASPQHNFNQTSITNPSSNNGMFYTSSTNPFYYSGNNVGSVGSNNNYGGNNGYATSKYRPFYKY